MHSRRRAQAGVPWPCTGAGPTPLAVTGVTTGVGHEFVLGVVESQGSSDNAVPASVPDLAALNAAAVLILYGR